MKSNQMDDEIKELFHQFPPVTDHRSRDEVYQNVMSGLKRTRKKKKKRIFWPAAASVAALFILFILGRSFNENMNFDLGANSADEYSSGSETEQENQQKMEIFQDDGNMDRKETESTEITAFHKTAVYDEMVAEDDVVVTLLVPDDQVQNMIPVSVIEKKLPDKSPADYLNDVMNRIDEESLGLMDYYPYNGSILMEEEDNVRLDLANGHTLTWGSAGERTFLRSIQSFKGLGINKVYLSEDGSPGVYFSHLGETIYEVETNGEQGQGPGYFIFHTEDGHEYFSPGPEIYHSITDALEDMKTTIETHNLTPSIPAEILFSVSEADDGSLKIYFENLTKITDDKEIYQMFEAILLAAKDFSYRYVEFQNAGNGSLGDFNLAEPVQVPVAPNLIELSSE